MTPSILQPYSINSEGKWVKYGSVVTVTPSGNNTSSYIRVAEKPQKSYATIDAMKSDNSIAEFSLPSDANYVLWDNSWSDDLDTAFKKLGSNDILVMQERDAPYYLDLSNGFSAPTGTQSVEGWPTALRTGNTWFCGTRGGRGLIGLGPGCNLQYKSGTWKAPAQPKDWGYVDDKGTRQAFSSAEVTALQFSNDDAYVGNFSVGEAPDLGGIAYGFVGFTKKGSTTASVFRTSTKGGWYGFAGDPNGEIGFLNFTTGTVRVSDCFVDSKKSDGTDSGVSPIMGNSGHGGYVKRSVFKNAWRGMPTFWNCDGTWLFEDFVSINNYSYGINLEKNQSGATFNFIRGYLDVGSKQGSPAMHIGIGSYAQNATVSLTDTQISPNGNWAGQLSVQGYSDVSGGVRNQSASSISYTLNGTAQTIHFAS